ncbi:phage tail assembly protein [Marinobacter adhaerens]|uniref:phage tail assembly protein n=1 Tax=Marinobacter adhaerens TaxID=1033846 RepID=UPI003D2BC8A9
MSEEHLPEFLTETDQGVTIDLVKPAEVDGATVKAVTMREPTVQDHLTVEALKGSEAAKEVQLMSNLCEVSTDAIKALTLRNYKRLQVALEFFTE